MLWTLKGVFFDFGIGPTSVVQYKRSGFLGLPLCNFLEKKDRERERERERFFSPA